MSAHRELAEHVLVGAANAPQALLAVTGPEALRLIDEHRTSIAAQSAMHADLLDLIDAMRPVLAGDAGPGDWHTAERVLDAIATKYGRNTK